MTLDDILKLRAEKPDEFCVLVAEKVMGYEWRDGHRKGERRLHCESIGDVASMVYVGQTTNIGSRIHDHRKSKDFDRALFMRVAKKDALAIEAAYILRFTPKYNDPYPLEQLAKFRNLPT